mmetsp:Transcript_6018/g.14623  ORF Transcript_6018/g.14623 Transcript_6018/m.14623 type:complete len:99 (-) Transcript_6018:3374-3670(-)
MHIARFTHTFLHYNCRTFYLHSKWTGKVDVDRYNSTQPPFFHPSWNTGKEKDGKEGKRREGGWGWKGPKDKPQPIQAGATHAFTPNMIACLLPTRSAG